MRKLILVAATLAAGALGLNQAAAQQAQQQVAEGMKVTGMVTEADQEKNEIKIGDKTFVMPDSAGGAAMWPQIGAEVTVFYEEQGGKNVITRIGQAQ